MCYFVPFIELVVSHTSVLTILSITVERYYAICLPLQASRICTKTKACLTCIVAWLLASLLTAPVLLMVEFDADASTCLTEVDSVGSKAYFVFIIIVFFFIPCLILVLLYRHIARHLVPPNSSNVGDDEQIVSESASVLRSRRQVVAMLVAVIACFFACILPFKVLTLWIVAAPYDIHDVVDVETYYNLLYFSRLMFYINSAINPILYNIMSSKFRDGFRRLCSCARGPNTATSVFVATANTHLDHTSSSHHKTMVERVQSNASTLNTVTSLRRAVMHDSLANRRSRYVNANWNSFDVADVANNNKKLARQQLRASARPQLARHAELGDRQRDREHQRVRGVRRSLSLDDRFKRQQSEGAKRSRSSNVVIIEERKIVVIKNKFDDKQDNNKVNPYYEAAI